MDKPLMPEMPPMTAEEIALNEWANSHGIRKIRKIWTRLGFLLILITSFFIYRDWAARLPFDSAQWQSSMNIIDSDLRGRMFSDLMRNQPIVGLNRKQILTLLGQPDNDSAAPEITYRVACLWDGSLKVLALQFNQQEKVVKYNVEIQRGK